MKIQLTAFRGEELVFIANQVNLQCRNEIF